MAHLACLCFLQRRGQCQCSYCTRLHDLFGNAQRQKLASQGSEYACLQETAACWRADLLVMLAIASWRELSGTAGVTSELRDHVLLGQWSKTCHAFCGIAPQLSMLG